jgi:hypothetical protein
MSTEPSAEDVRILAAVVSRQSLDLNTYAGFLLNALDGALPAEVVTVTRKKAMFGRNRSAAPILCVTVLIDDERYVLERPNPTAAPIASVGHVVGGIVLRTETVPLAVWSQRLATALAELAGRNADSAAALQRMTDFQL